MNVLKAACLWGLTAAIVGCSYIFGSRDSSPVSESAAQRSDVYASESRTLSGLATIENAIHDYIKGEGKIPGRIDDMIPKYLASIPVIELGLSGYSDNSKVRNYPASVIRDGVIDGSQLKDTGYWGYAHNDRQVIIFVDCIRADSRGKPWYKERGVF